MVKTIKDVVQRTKKALKDMDFYGNQYWPAGVLNQLEVEYHLKPEDMLRLGYLRRKFGRNNKNFTLYIYDRFTASDKKILVKDVNDIYDSPDLLLFKGSVTVDGAIHLDKVRNFN
ncbi:hypothetical protein ACFLXY_11070 [Chloroflexota bacterium]